MASEKCNCRVPITLRDFFWQDPFFSATWDDFDNLHKKMVSETKQLWDKFDQQLKGLECQEAATKDAPKETDDIKDTENSGSGLIPRQLTRLPSIFNDEMTKDLLIKDDQAIKFRDDDKVFEVSLNTHNYRPDEIKVNVEGKVLSIEGRHEEKSEDGHSFTSRRFVRKYTLPDSCPADQVASNLSADGVLLVTAPKTSATPIQMEKK